MSFWEEETPEMLEQLFSKPACRQCVHPMEKGICTCGRGQYTNRNWAASMGFGDGGDSFESFKKRLDRLEALVRELMEKEKP